MFLGDDLLPFLVLAIGAAMLVGNALTVFRPPPERRASDLDRPPMGRSVLMMVVGAVASIWALASLVTG